MPLSDEARNNSLPKLRQFPEEGSEIIPFRGWLEIAGAPFVIPEQDFIATFTGDQTIALENRAVTPWPRISIKLAIDSITGNAKVRQFDLRPVEASTDAEIVYTRIQYVLGKIGRCVLQFGDCEDILPFRFDPPTSADEQKLLHRAKIYRKLKYIEQVFKTSFLLPKEISADDVAAIEFIFRSITDGEFSFRQQAISLPLDPSKVDLSVPPFQGSGRLIYQPEEDWLELFGRRLLIGKPVVAIHHAEVASPGTIRQIRQGQPGPIWGRFAILDHQIHYRLENRATKPAKRLQQQKLKFFKQELLKNEPLELADLLYESLMADVSAEEASLIATGWTQYNKLPDRYCPQTPLLVSPDNVWRVPLWLGYPNGQGGEVGELLVDVKTGKVVSHTPLEEVRHRGKKLARELLHASEAAIS